MKPAHTQPRGQKNAHRLHCLVNENTGRIGYQTRLNRARQFNNGYAWHRRKDGSLVAIAGNNAIIIDSNRR